MEISGNEGFVTFGDEHFRTSEKIFLRSGHRRSLEG